MSSDSTTQKTGCNTNQSTTSSPSNPQEEPSKSGNGTSNTAPKTTAFTTAWGSTSGKPYLSSPRLDDPKSSSVIKSYFSRDPAKKDTASGSEAGKTD